MDSLGEITVRTDRLLAVFVSIGELHVHFSDAHIFIHSPGATLPSENCTETSITGSGGGQLSFKQGRCAAFRAAENNKQNSLKVMEISPAVLISSGVG